MTMRLQLHGWLVLASLFAGGAMAGAPTAAIMPRTCDEAIAAVETAKTLSVEQEAQIDALCAADPEPLPRDPELQRALDQWHEDYSRAVAARVRELMERNDARSQLAAALIAPAAGPTPPSDRGLDWNSREAAQAFAAARLLDPDDVLVVWIEAMDCPHAGAHCDRERALARLQTLEPDNAAVWLMSMQRALERGDGAAASRHLAQAAQAARHTHHFGEIGQLLHEALVGVSTPAMTPCVARSLAEGMNRPATADDVAAVQAMGLAVAIALPAFAPLGDMCGVSDAALPEQRMRECIQVHVRLADSPELISRLIGLVRLVRLTADRPEGAQWRERLRELRWLQDRATPLVRNAPAGYAWSVWRDGEVEAMKDELAAAGQPTAPPTGWLPNDAHGRALITTGRPPLQEAPSAR